MRHCLVIANRGLSGPSFEQWVSEYLADGVVHFHLVVPIVLVEGRINWTEEEARENARRRLRHALRRLREIGALADGEVTGDDGVSVAALARGRRGYDSVVWLDEPAGLLSAA